MGHKHTTKALSTSAHRLPISDRRRQTMQCSRWAGVLRKVKDKGRGRERGVRREKKGEEKRMGEQEGEKE